MKEEEKKRTPWWLWPNLLSLDAPLVAMAWLWMFAKLWYVRYQDGATYWVLGGVVWMIYVLDRLCDAKAKPGVLRARHHFHWKHRKLLRILVGVVFVACLLGFIFGIPTAMVVNWPWLFPPGTSWATPVEVVQLVLLNTTTHGSIVLLFALGFFLISRGDDTAIDSVLLKNVFAAMAFGYGTAMGAHFYRSEGVFGMLWAFEVLGFALLCLMNLNAIDIWEREDEGGEELGVRVFLLNLPLLILGLVSVLASRFWHEHHKPFFYSMLVASAALLMVDHFRDRLSVELKRVLADVALLLPLPIFWFWF